MFHNAPSWKEWGPDMCEKFSCASLQTLLFKIQSKLVWYYICIFAMDSVDLKMSYNVSLSLLRKYNDI